MNIDEIKQHWESWAKEYGANLRATTKTPTVKSIELYTLSRALERILDGSETPLRVLEMGCGNGMNCLYLAKQFPFLKIRGVDYVDEMIGSARQMKESEGIGDRVIFEVGNVLDLKFPASSFDVIFTDRCLINLNSDELQKQALDGLHAALAAPGHLVMIENSRQSHARQNRLREIADLPARLPASFNHFFDETVILPHLEALGFAVAPPEDPVTLHDVMLYVLLPMINGGKVDYEHPLVEAAARLSIAMEPEFGSGMGSFGQNRLYVCRKE